jgi:hypothetical protein
MFNLVIGTQKEKIILNKSEKKKYITRTKMEKQCISGTILILVI